MFCANAGFQQVSHAIQPGGYQKWPFLSCQRTQLAPPQFFWELGFPESMVPDQPTMQIPLEMGTLGLLVAKYVAAWQMD